MTIPDGVTSIGNDAFYYCTGLASVKIPASVKSIGSTAFSWCDDLTDVIYDGTEEQWKAITKGYSYGLSGMTITRKDADGKKTTWTAE